MIYENGALSKILTEEGYITLSGSTPTYHYYLKDHLGNNRVVLNQNGTTVEQVSHYYPFGGLFDQTSETVQAYKYNGKELDRTYGIDLYDYSARFMDGAVGRFTTMDPMAEKYYSVSPYGYVMNNPMNAIDLKGDSITVLNLGSGTNQHMGLLIQNKEGKWSYFSMNGDWVYTKTGGKAGGKPYHDTGEKTFNSPQEFLESSYNAKGNKEQIENDNVNNYGFTEGYVLPTTLEQDNIISSTFLDFTKEGYSLIDNQCAQVVQKSLNAVGIETREAKFMPNDSQTMTGTYIHANPYLPSNAFRAIMRNNLGGLYLKKR